MTIAVIVKYFPTVSETFIVNQINALIDQGHQVSIYSYNKVNITILHESLLKYNLIQTVNYFQKPNTSKVLRFINAIKFVFKNCKKLNWTLFFKSINLIKFGKDAYTLKLFYELQWFLILNDFDVVHAHFGPNAKRIAYIKALGFLPQKTKLITTFHGYDLMPNNLKFYKKEYDELLQQGHAFTVNTVYLKNLLLELKHDLSNVHILPVGLDTNTFKRTKAKRITPYFDIVFCGKLIPLKGPDIAVKILKYLHDSGFKQVRLHLIGDGKMNSTIEDLIHNLQMKDFVKMYGNLSQEEVKHHFEQADVFLLPGREDPDTGRAETQGLVLQEAQAMELPVVVSDIGGMKYGVLPEETGFVIKVEDIKEFAKAIKRLILNPGLKNKMGKEGRDFVCEYYDNKILVKKLLVIYKESLKPIN